MTTGLAARSKPYREPVSGRRTCNYCGINMYSTSKSADYYCPSCTPAARELGWIAPKQTYNCTRCGKTVEGAARELCSRCTSTIKQRKNR